MNYLGQLWNWAVGLIVRGISQSVSWLADLFWQVLGWWFDVILAVWEWLPFSDPFEEWLLGTDMQSMLDHAIQLMRVIDLVLWLFPVAGVALLYTGTYGVCATIRLVRWVLAFMPTIGG